jgi:hypothetical protein
LRPPLLPEGTAIRPLDPDRPYKPLDVGQDGVSVTQNDRGRLLAVIAAHPQHGTVVLAAGAGFVEDHRFDSDAVRRYRRRLASRRAESFGFSSHEDRGGNQAQEFLPSPAWLLEDALPVTRLGGTQARIVTFVPHLDDCAGQRGVVQLALDRLPAPLRWSGRLRLDRAEYPELREGRPASDTGRLPHVFSRHDGAAIGDARLGVAAGIAGMERPSLSISRNGLAVIDGQMRSSTAGVVIGLGNDINEAIAAAHALAEDREALLDATLQRWRRRWNGEMQSDHLGLVRRRGLGYLLGCCAPAIGESVCLTTDHRILPLAWTRDAYYAASALLAWADRGGPSEAADVVRRHLAWLFEVADRPDGWWARSHLSTGQRKDPAFQLDQQLFPLLELIDYTRLTGDRRPMSRYRDAIDDVLRAIDARQSTAAVLFASEETPADDPLALPYQTANQILAWYVLGELARHGVGAGRLERRAEAIRRAIFRHLVVPGPDGTPIFAYASDLAGTTWRYHDANDLPMAMAPRWGFCPANDPIWRATMRFAFSNANEAFARGARGGLGSLHTPGAWPLGRLQEWLVADATADRQWADMAADQLGAMSYWDGALPEANDPRTGQPISRPWFAWPGAAAASMLMQRETVRQLDQLIAPFPRSTNR